MFAFEPGIRVFDTREQHRRVLEVPRGVARIGPVGSRLQDQCAKRVRDTHPRHAVLINVQRRVHSATQSLGTAFNRDHVVTKELLRH